MRGAFLKCENGYMGRFCNTTQPAVISSLCSPVPTCSPAPPCVLLPIFHQAPVLFLLSLSFSQAALPAPPSTLPAPSVLFPLALFICFGPSGCLPWPPVPCFNVGPMGTGVHSKTGRACEQEAGSGAGGEQPAVTSAPRLPHLD